MIIKITSRIIPTVLAILGVMGSCLLFNGKITPSGKYELMANLGLSAYQNLANKNIEWVIKNEIMGVRLQSSNGNKELFVGLQKGSHFAPEKKNRPSNCSGKRSSGSSQDRYIRITGDFKLRLKVFSYSQKKAHRLSSNNETDDNITYLNYLYQKCSKDKIILLDKNKSNDPYRDAEKVEQISKFGVLIQISD